jgi:hypothetical protein
MKRRTMTSIQNIPDRKRVEAITISRQTRSKMPPTGLGAQCGAGHNKAVPQSPPDDAPPVQLHATDASGRATRLVRTPHRTDGDQDGPDLLDRRRLPATQPQCTRRSSPHRSRSRRANLTHMETSYDDLRRACRHRDPSCVDPLRHVFEDAMSGALPLRRTHF